MQLVSERLEKSVKYYEVEVSLEQVQEAYTKAFRKNANRISLPGFRPGKAPRTVVERRYGKEIFSDDALELILNDVVVWINTEYKPEAIDSPTADVKKFGADESAIVELGFPLKPEVKLGEYLGIEAVKLSPVIDQAQLDEALNSKREEHARLITLTEGLAENGDTVQLDYEGSIDEIPFEGGSANDFSLVLGSGRFIPGFEDQLIGKPVGEPLEVRVTFPEDYRATDLAGKEAIFKCLIKEIKRRELLPLDDDFAQEVSEFDTLIEWQESYLKELQENADLEAANNFRLALVNKIVEATEMDIPDVMIERQMDYNMRQFEYRLSSQGLDLNVYLNIINSDIDRFREDFRDISYDTVKRMLTLEAIVKAENIEVEEAEVDAELKRIFGFSQAEANDLDDVDETEVEVSDDVSNQDDNSEESIELDETNEVELSSEFDAYRDEVRQDLMIQKAVELIVSKAVAIDPPAETETEGAAPTVNEDDSSEEDPE